MTLHDKATAGLRRPDGLLAGVDEMTGQFKMRQREYHVACWAVEAPSK